MFRFKTSGVCSRSIFSRWVSVKVARRLNDLEWLAGLSHSRESGNPDSYQSRHAHGFPKQAEYGLLLGNLCSDHPTPVQPGERLQPKSSIALSA